MMRLRRARPWLGTLVEVHVEAIDETRALAAIEAAFAEIAAVHRLMSFHAPDSDLSRLNRDAARDAVAVDPRTFEVIALALAFARESRGCFDPTVARELVAWGLLPAPHGAAPANPAADWHDVVCADDGTVRYARPLWLDLGGIAKGYAVDRAIELLRETGVESACVNAGGDLRRIGPGSEPVHVRHPAAPALVLPGLELAEGSVASSAGYFVERGPGARAVGPHLHGRRRDAVGLDAAVTVIAARCAVADALTKIALADAQIAQGVLAKHAAEACVHDADSGWRMLSQAAQADAA